MSDQQPKYTLLIVDDEPDLVEILADEFSGDAHIRCVTAVDGVQAIEVVKKERPDAIISDINMPGLDGLEMLAKLRENGFDTPFIFLSAYGDRQKLVRALRLGANDFFDKPYDRKVLHASVEKALELGRKMKSIDEELEVWCASLPADQRERVREVKRELLALRKQRETYFK